ncbi:MAG: hypothetical protein ACJ8AO_09325 [Gemmatimonadaceae bacterium]
MSTPHLLVRLRKNADGSAVLSCERADGSVTWQRQFGRRGAFFPQHDLTHFAVETTLGHRRGFFGLVAEGWDFADFGAPWPRGRIPEDADPSELIVGFLDIERTTGVEMTADELDSHARTSLASRGGDAAAWQPISAADLARVREAARMLLVRWAALVPGEALELHFEAVSR